jgi:hypothetical protein
MAIYHTSNGVPEHSLRALRAEGAPEWLIKALRRLARTWGRID